MAPTDDDGASVSSSERHLANLGKTIAKSNGPVESGSDSSTGMSAEFKPRQSARARSAAVQKNESKSKEKDNELPQLLDRDAVLKDADSSDDESVASSRIISILKPIPPKPKEANDPSDDEVSEMSLLRRKGAITQVEHTKQEAMVQEANSHQHQAGIMKGMEQAAVFRGQAGPAAKAADQFRCHMHEAKVLMNFANSFKVEAKARWQPTSPLPFADDDDESLDDFDRKMEASRLRA